MPQLFSSRSRGLHTSFGIPPNLKLVQPLWEAALAVAVLTASHLVAVVAHLVPAPHRDTDRLCTDSHLLLLLLSLLLQALLGLPAASQALALLSWKLLLLLLLLMIGEAWKPWHEWPHHPDCQPWTSDAS